MTSAQFEDFIESLISGSGDPNWTPEEVAIYADVATTVTYSNIWHLLYPSWRKSALISLTGSDPYVSLPADCFKPAKIQILSTGEDLEFLETEGELINFDTVNPGEPQAWMLENKKIRVIPMPAAGASDYGRLWYMPKLDTPPPGSSKWEFLPEEVHPLVAVESVLLAKFKDKEFNQQMMALQAKFFGAVVNAFSVARP